jgi:hypothetical protein
MLNASGSNPVTLLSSRFNNHLLRPLSLCSRISLPSAISIGINQSQRDKEETSVGPQAWSLCYNLSKQTFPSHGYTPNLSKGSFWSDIVSLEWFIIWRKRVFLLQSLPQWQLQQQTVAPSLVDLKYYHQIFLPPIHHAMKRKDDGTNLQHPGSP